MVKPEIYRYYDVLGIDVFGVKSVHAVDSALLQSGIGAHRGVGGKASGVELVARSLGARVEGRRIVHGIARGEHKRGKCEGREGYDFFHVFKRPLNDELIFTYSLTIFCIMQVFFKIWFAPAARAPFFDCFPAIKSACESFKTGLPANRRRIGGGSSALSLRQGTF